MPSPFEMGRAIGGNISGGIRGGQENNRIDQILEQAQNTNDPHIMDNIMRQIVTQVSPEKRPAIIEYMKQKQGQIIESNTQKEMKNVADTIEANNPNSASHKILANIFRSDMPTAQKEKIGKLINDTSAFKVEQSQRLANDSIIKNYNSLIKELNEDKKNMTGTNKIERKKKIDKRIAYLKDQRDRLFKFNSNLPDEDKISFDPNNPEHVNEAKALQAQGKTKSEIKTILEEKYEF